MNKRVYLSPPELTGNEIKYVMEAFDTNWVAPLGPLVDRFEEVVSKKLGISSALALSSGTAALHLAVKYFGIGRGDLVLCSSLTFAGSCNPVYYENGDLAFIDSEKDSWNMSPDLLEQALHDCKKQNRLPKAVIVVNIYGQSADYDRILPICQAYNVPVIEDAAESLGAKYKGKYSGSFGHFGVFSFNGNKIVTTSGGGMLVSNDKTAMNKCRYWSTQAREKVLHYEHKEIGYNYRMSNILAGIGIGQFEQIDEKVRKRKDIFLRYAEAFKDIDEISMNPVPDWSEPNYWLTVISIDPSSRVLPITIIEALEAENIESRPVWKPMHMQPVFKGCKFYSKDNESLSEHLFKWGVCLPSGTSMTPQEQDKVVEIIKELFRSKR